MQRVFFCNSGAEANEGAFKLSRKWGKGRYEIITANDSFHGRTLAAVTATGQTKYQAGFEPLVEGFKHVKYNDIEAIKSALSEKTVGIMLEPIQAEGGIVIPSKDYLKEVQNICKQNNLLLIIDEIQTGMGRSGKFLAYEHFDISPDIVTVAKALGGGFPIGAFLTTEEISHSFEFGNHGSTFGGGEFVTGIALEFLKILDESKIIENAEKSGKYFLQKLFELKNKFPKLIEDVRGIGLLCGIQFKEEYKAADIADKLVLNGLLVASAGKNVIRFVPPLIISENDINKAVIIINEVFSNI